MSGQKRKIVIVDDEAHIIRVLKLKLTNAGYEVVCASNGLEAAEIIESEIPDVVISDINMPKLNGKELYFRTVPLKKEKNFLSIIMTCSLAKEDRGWIPSGDRIEFIEKPFSPKEILKIIEQAGI